MLIPSYSNLIDILNEEMEQEEKIVSRYSIVVAAAKRARQIVGGASHDTMGVESDKAVSIAVNELYNGNISIIPAENEEITIIPKDPILQGLPPVIEIGMEGAIASIDNDSDEEVYEDEFKDEFKEGFETYDEYKYEESESGTGEYGEGFESGGDEYDDDEEYEDDE